jgi:broad specificity phosphatase PhoE
MKHLKTFLLIYFIAIGLCTVANAGLKIYYIRHGQSGKNVLKRWEKNDVPKSEWPSYVGNSDVFTPTGEKQVAAATEKLKTYPFDFIASSPLWRARNTILPYLKETHSKAEVWPELREAGGYGSILSKEIPVLEDEILNRGEPIILPEEELPYFILRDDAKNNYSQYPENSPGLVRAAYLKHATLSAIKLIEQRFGGTDQTILLTGHGTAGRSLLQLLLQEAPKVKKGIGQTGIWMVEQQEDGSYRLKMYNSEVYSEK